MKKICNFCNKEITKRYRCLKNEKGTVYQCRSCERWSKTYDHDHEYKFHYNGDVRKEKK